MSSYLGEFLWYELMSTDPAGAEAFYRDVIGWTTVSDSVAAMPYTMWKAGECTIGGLMQLPEAAQQSGAPTHWLGYVGTPDLDGAVRRMEELGGSIYVPPMVIPDVGRIAVFADPFGAVLAMYEPASQDPPSGHVGSGHFSWHELFTTDLDGAWAFYENLFGWNKTMPVDMGPEHGIYQLFGRGERNLGGMMKKPAAMPGPSAWLYYITVRDIHATIERVRAGGGMLLNGPMEVPGGDLVAPCMDPQGGAFALHQRGGAA